jgi:O-methyltransferase involved in polyketide biosynthesis
VIVAVEQFEPSPLVHDPWAAKLLPLSGRLAVSLAKWPPARTSTLKTTEKKDLHEELGKRKTRPSTEDRR